MIMVDVNEMLAAAEQACRLGQQRLVRNGYTAEAVSGYRGVQRVYRVTVTTGRYRTVYYVKRSPTREIFVRNLAAFSHLARVAEASESVIVPELIGYCEHRLLIATRAMSGTSLHEMLVRGARYDRIPWWPQVDITAGAAAIARGFTALHERGDPGVGGLADHSGQHRAHVLRTKVDRLHSYFPEFCARIAPAITRVRSRLTECASTRSYLNGDTSPTNLFICGTQLGLIDYEDAGVGDWRRDVAFLLYCLSQAERDVRYSHARVARFRRTLLEGLAIAADDAMFRVYRVEFLINALWSAAHAARDPRLPSHGQPLASVQPELQALLSTL